jgi:hypothetical protein
VGADLVGELALAVGVVGKIDFNHGGGIGKFA